MRSMRHVRKGQKARAAKSRNAVKNRAHKRHNASKRVWLKETQFWESKVGIEDKYLAKVVIGGTPESSSATTQQTKAQTKAKAHVAEQKPSVSQVNAKPSKKAQKEKVEEVVAKKVAQQTQSAANGVAGKQTDVKKAQVVEQLRVEINEKQYTDNDDMKSSVDSGVDVDHKPATTPNVAERMAEMTGEVVDAVDEEPCVLKTQIRCGERCGCDRILDEHYHHDHDSSESTPTPNTAEEQHNTQKESILKSAEAEKQSEPAETESSEADNKATRFSENVAKFVDLAQKKLGKMEVEPAVVEKKAAPVAAAPVVPTPVAASPVAASPVAAASAAKRRERQYKLLPRDVDFCTYMMETHGDNYEAMANDLKNIYRDTATGIARKLRIFRESPQYEEYLQTKNA